MLIRTALVQDGKFLDPDSHCVHVHIDTVLAAKKLGYDLFMEPSARVTYVAFNEYLLGDLTLFQDRWSQAEAEASIEAFSRKWNVINDNRSFGKVRQFLRTHSSGRSGLRPVLTENWTCRCGLAATASGRTDTCCKYGEQCIPSPAIPVHTRQQALQLALPALRFLEAG